MAELSMKGPSMFGEAVRRVNVGLLRPMRGKGPTELKYALRANDGKMRFQSSFAPVHNVDQALTYEDWIKVDQEVTSVARRNLHIVADARAAMSVDLGGLGTTIYNVQRRNRSGKAQIDMSPTTESPEYRSSYSYDGVPVPITHEGFRFNIREVSGRPYLETDQAGDATRDVTDLLEQMFLGTIPPFQFGDAILYGLYTHPQRLTMAVGDWTVITGEQVNTAVVNMIQTAKNNGLKGPFTLYVPTNYQSLFGLDYKTYAERTTLERVLANPDVAAVKTADVMRPSEPLLVDWGSRMTGAGIGQDIIPVQWQTMGPLETEYKVMCAIIPIIKTGYNDRNANRTTGYVHGTIA